MSKNKSKNFYKDLSAELEKGTKLSAAQRVIDLGATVSELRRQKKISAKQLCEKGGLDPKTLNAVEKGRIKNPSIQTLQALAAGFEITVGDLFRQAELKFDRNLYAGNQKGFFQVDFHHSGVRVVSFTPFVKDFFCGKVILGSRKRLDHNLLQHPLPLYLSVLIGRVEISVEGKPFSLREGDNLFFNGILKHTFYNPLEREAVFLLVTAPSFM